jgi:hypothetical protein
MHLNLNKRESRIAIERSPLVSLIPHFPVPRHGHLEVLLQHEKIQNVRHVVILDCEDLAVQSSVVIEQRQSQAAQSRRLHLVLDPHHFDELVALQQPITSTRSPPAARAPTLK